MNYVNRKIIVYGLVIFLWQIKMGFVEVKVPEKTNCLLFTKFLIKRAEQRKVIDFS